MSISATKPHWNRKMPAPSTAQKQYDRLIACSQKFDAKQTEITQKKNKLRQSKRAQKLKPVQNNNRLPKNGWQDCTNSVPTTHAQRCIIGVRRSKNKHERFRRACAL